MPAIQARALAKSFAGRRACWDLSFTVERGEVFGLLGPNGAGKTTTLRMLAGLLAPDSGSATVAGEEVLPGRPGSAALRARIGLLTEAPGFYDRLTALENLVHFGRLQSLSETEATRRAGPLLERFALAAHASRPFAVLSRGMKQKLAIARALLHEPEVVFLDEPTVGLDPEATREVRAVIAELAAERRTIVLCTHHLDEVERLCGRAAFIAGRLLAIHDLKAPQHQRLRCVLLLPHAAGVAAARAVPGVLSVEEAPGQGGRAVLAVELAEQGAGAEQIAAKLVAALAAAGAPLCEVAPAGDPLEVAWLLLQEKARAEGLLG